MKLIFFLNLIFQVASFLTKRDIITLNRFDTVFFENVNFKGTKFIFYIIINPENSKNYFFNLGEYLIVPIETDECKRFPAQWQNRTSSILTNKCIVLFSSTNCISDKSTQVFTKTPGRYSGQVLSKPDNVPNNNFYKSM